jgi:hypothetical protein
MLDDLARHSHDPVDFRDRVPYVLALLAVITSTIDSESSGHRTAEFGAWWASVDRSAQRSMQEIRTAELKEQQSFTAVQVHSNTAVRAADYPAAGQRRRHRHDDQLDVRRRCRRPARLLHPVGLLGAGDRAAGGSRTETGVLAAGSTLHDLMFLHQRRGRDGRGSGARGRSDRATSETIS